MKKIFIRSNGASAQFVGRRGWIASKRRARSFDSALKAIHFCFENDLTDAEIVVHFGEQSSADVVVQIPPELTADPAPHEEWLFAHC